MIYISSESPSRMQFLLKFRAFTLIELMVILAIVSILLALLLPAVQYARESSRKLTCVNNIKQIGISLNSYLSSNQSFPPINLRTADLSGGGSVAINSHSPFSRLLPDLEYSSLYNSINFSLPPTFGRALGSNLTSMNSTLSILTCPSDTQPPVSGFGRINYRFSIGPTAWIGPVINKPETSSGPFQCWATLGPSNFNDGLSNTIGLSERLQGDWTKNRIKKNADFSLSPSSPPYLSSDAAVEFCQSLNLLPDVTLESRGGETWFVSGLAFTLYNHCDLPNSYNMDCVFQKENSNIHLRSLFSGSMSASSYHSKNVNVLMMDGSVRNVSNSIALPLWRALSTRASNDITPEF